MTIVQQLQIASFRDGFRHFIEEMVREGVPPDDMIEILRTESADVVQRAWNYLGKEGDHG